MMTAAQKVFNLPELIKSILLHLPGLNVIICQWVDATWRDIIIGSPRLQVKLWLRAENPHDEDQEDTSAWELDGGACEGMSPDSGWNSLAGVFPPASPPRLRNNSCVIMESRIKLLCETGGPWRKMVVRRQRATKLVLLCMISAKRNPPTMENGTRSPQPKFAGRVLRKKAGITLADVWKVCQEKDIREFNEIAIGADSTRVTMLIHRRQFDQEARRIT